MCTSHGESFLGRKKDLGSETDRWHERPRCEHSGLGFFHICHTSSCSPSWTRLFNEFAIRQKKVFEVCGTIIRDNWEVDQRADGDDRSVYDQLGTSVCGENRLCCVTELFELCMNSKTYVFDDSVLCLGGISPEPVQAWKGKIKWYLETRYLKEVDRSDGEQMEFEWKNFPEFTTLGILNDSKDDGRIKVWTWAISKRGSSSCPMFNDIAWREIRKRKQLFCEFFACCNICQKGFH